MNNAKRITRLTIETERTFIFRSRRSTEARWCAECGTVVEMSYVDAAATASGLSEMIIYRSIEARALHFAEDEDGRVLVCPNSLLKRTNERSTI
ncbi:MAG TPA: hypothetical protein VFO63_19685 [Blastocatellia bacterium]|jgi:hypothetical protein|nr:hypothetical protein [Blastocatellia bacterium]